MTVGLLFNPLPDENSLGLPKLKAFADNKLNINQNVKVVFHRKENILGKEENAGYHNVFKGFFLQCVKSRCVVKG